MSQENVELSQRMLQHYIAAGEPMWDAIDRSVEVYDNDIPDAGSYRGHDGYAKWLADWSEAWSAFDFEIERWIDAGEKVVVIFRLTTRGRSSGVEVARRDAMVMTYRERLQVRLEYFNDISQALEAAGLSEQDALADP